MSVVKQQRVAPPRRRGVLMSSRQVADTAQNDARVAGSSRQRGSVCRSCGVGICWPGRCYTCATGRPRRILRAEERLIGTPERAELSVRTSTGERPHLELVTGRLCLTQASSSHTRRDVRTPGLASAGRLATPSPTPDNPGVACIQIFAGLKLLALGAGRSALTNRVSGERRARDRRCWPGGCR